MDNSKSLELDILITVYQNKKIPPTFFHHLFEHKWKLYSSRFNELVHEELFQIVESTVTGGPVYELTRKGKVRVSELLEQREKDIIAYGLAHLNPSRHVIRLDWKSIMASLRSAIHFPAPKMQITNPEQLSE